MKTFLKAALAKAIGLAKTAHRAALSWTKAIFSVAFAKIILWAAANPRVAAALATSTFTSLYGFFAGETAVAQQAAVIERLNKGIELALTVFA